MGERSDADSGLYLVWRDGVLIFDVLLGQTVIEFSGLVDEVMSPEFGHFDEIVWNLSLLNHCPEFAAIKVVRLHLKQVDETFKVVAGTDWNLHCDWVGAKSLADGVEREFEVGTDLVHLVDECNSWHMISIGLPPDSLALGFDAFLAVKYGNRAVEYTH